MSLSIVLDVIVVVMLGVTIYYAAILKSRLATLRRDETEMQARLAAFSDAAAKAEVSLANAKGHVPFAGAGAGGAEIVAKSKEVIDDLNFLIERGDAMADRLVKLLREARGATTAPEREQALGNTVAGTDPVGPSLSLLCPEAVFRDAGKTPPSRQDQVGVDVVPHSAPALSTAERDLMNKLRAVR